MDRRDLLTIGCAGAAFSISGCIDQIEDELREDEFANEVEATQVDYESDAEQLEFEERSFGYCTPGQMVVPGGICSDDPVPLTRTESSDDFARPSIRVYGIVFNSQEDVEQLIDGQRFDEGRAEEDDIDGDDIEFVDETDFTDESLLVIQAEFPTTASLSIDFVGVSDDTTTYVTTHSTMAYGEEVTYERRLLRITRPSLPETIVVGQSLRPEDEDQPGHTIYTNEE
ncbi:hypothetical protein OB905_01170 [Halobacteria archaeon AArc-dxtr1]|nr:hypothetical protein [Halobacteria archaeon AArc-dxtr1]